jgi:competence protein ComEC
VYFKLIKIIISITLSFLFASCNSNSNQLIIHFIDVGQGDATLLEFNEKTLLIDSGPNIAEEKISKYLKKNNITTINYLIATHPHEDHIGNIDYILENFKVKNFLAPKVLYESQDFTNMIKKLQAENLKINVISGSTKNIINLDASINIDFFSPNKKYENTNNYSPIIKLTHGNNSFLFTGDAEKEVELSILHKNLDSDVLKVGHHGSASSSTKEFLDIVTPKISIISCGINNQFNHPHSQTLENLNFQDSLIYRTDEDGTIILASNGKNIKKK